MAEDAVPDLNMTATKIYQTLDVNKTPRMPNQHAMHAECDQLLKRKREMLAKQKSQVDAITELLNSKEVTISMHL